MDIVKYFEKLSIGFKDLAHDAEVMANDLQKPEDQKKKSFKSFQPMTRIRKDKNAVDKAKANPEIAFIEDKIKDILKG